jgi:ABC-type nickel/cobalt efflux system permease component RcnA
MMTTPGLLAGIFRVNEENSIWALIPSQSSTVQVLIYFGALLLVALGIFVWAVTFHRQRYQQHSHHHHSKPPTKHQHHQQPETFTRPRTLAETGGLPPIRTGQPPFPD